jgi:hypothetical protein
MGPCRHIWVVWRAGANILHAPQSCKIAQAVLTIKPPITAPFAASSGLPATTVLGLLFCATSLIPDSTNELCVKVGAASAFKIRRPLFPQAESTDLNPA